MNKFLKYACKYALIDLFTENKLINESLNNDQILNMVNFIKNLPYGNLLAMVFDNDFSGKPISEGKIRDFEGKGKKLLKYSGAIIAGNRLLEPVFSQMNTRVITSTAIYFTFRKLMDPCWRKCLTRGFTSYNPLIVKLNKQICKYECHSLAAKNIMDIIEKEKNKCETTDNIAACEKHINKEYSKWAKKYHEALIKLSQAKANLHMKTRFKYDAK